MGKLFGRLLLVWFGFDVVIWFQGLGCFDILRVRSGFITGLGVLRLGACASAALTSCAHEGGATKQFHELPGQSQPGKYRTLVKGGRLVQAAAPASTVTVRWHCLGATANALHCGKATRCARNLLTVPTGRSLRMRAKRFGPEWASPWFR